jgi:hypothetical protein
MLAFAPTLSLLLLLASQVSAFNFNISFGTGTLNGSELLPTSYNGAIATCSSNCSIVQNELVACQNDATCLCTNTTLVAELRNCEQCMYQSLIEANAPMPPESDQKAGSTPMLVGYQTACSAFNFTLNATQVSLTLPANWDGPFGLGLNTGGTVVSVIFAFIIGMSSLVILSNV